MGADQAGPRVGGPLRTLFGLTTATVSISLRYRVTALAAEVGFFALLSLPPLVLALAAAAAWIGSRLGQSLELETAVREYLTPFLTTDVVETVILPTLSDALNTPRIDVISLGFALSLWSGSRAMHVYVDTISIMYGLAGARGIVATRALSFGLYLLALVVGSVALPLMLLGPNLIGRLLPAELAGLNLAYWPVVGVAGIVSIALLCHVSVPLRTAWWRNLPGAVLAVLLWVLASYLMRLALAFSLAPSESAGPAGTRSLSIYGPLTTPIVVLLWFYLLAVAVLIGAALNVAVDQRWPDGRRSQRRADLARRLRATHARESMLTPVHESGRDEPGDKDEPETV